jgi:aryl-phospho-beta-D-glucosidase BglC (GH1 family)
MAAQGINTVRLPIGYFSVGPWFTRNSPFAAYAPV